MFPGTSFSEPGATPQRLVIAMLAMLVAVAVMLLSTQQMVDLREALPLLSQGLIWLEMLPLPLNMHHVVFFALVAGLLRLSLPGVHAAWMLLLLVALAVGTELLQFLTVGRTASLQDARDDMVGAGIGLLLGSLPLWGALQARRVVHGADLALLGGVLLLPVQQWSPLSAFGFLLVPSDLLFVVAIALRAFAWAGGRAPLPVSGFHGWLAAYVLAMPLAVLLLWLSRTATTLLGMVCLLPSLGFAGASATRLGAVYLALVSVVACDAVQRVPFPRRPDRAWLLGGLSVALLSILAMLGVTWGDPFDGMQWSTAARYVWRDAACHAGLPALVALAGLCGWLAWRGAACARAAGGVVAGVLLALTAASLYAGLAGPFGQARSVWVLIGLLAGVCMACVREAVPSACIHDAGART